MAWRILDLEHATHKVTYAADLNAHTIKEAIVSDPQPVDPVPADPEPEPDDDEAAGAA